VSRKSSPWEVWFADLDPVVGSEQGRKRPVVIVSSRLFAAFPTAMAIVVPLSSVDRGLPHHVPVSSPESGLDRVSWARVDDVRSLSERRLGRKLGVVAEKEAAAIRGQLRLMIDL
jgi:mRNA interferase MazF